jgi:L-2,4-diaminobutyrate transaminase
MFENARTAGAYLQSRLRETLTDHPLVAEVRGRDMIAAVEFADTNGTVKPFDPALKVGRRVAQACLERGLLTRALPAADTISFSPPLIIDEAEIDELVSTVQQAVDEVALETIGAGRG